MPDPQLYTPEGVPFAYVSIGFSTGMNPVTKAETPTGGEDGDDPEAGQYYENQINNIHLFFYNVKDPASDPGNTRADGVNMHPDTAIVAHKYLTSGEFSYNNNGTGTESQATTHSGRELAGRELVSCLGGGECGGCIRFDFTIPPYFRLFATSDGHEALYL